jgi:hypothetical protein
MGQKEKKWLEEEIECCRRRGGKGREGKGKERKSQDYCAALVRFFPPDSCFCTSYDVNNSAPGSVRPVRQQTDRQTDRRLTSLRA